QKILKHNLNMKLIDVEYTFDNNKILFYFTSDERVDFRELVKDLAAVFRTRIELRQIGVRDETKMCGGIGICGRGLCCNKFLSDFQPVSIKMAKDQSLSLNPTKISGICGRLMCCLKYEEDVYVEIRGRLPEVGDMVETPDGRGEVLSVTVLREQVRVAVKKKDKDEKEAIVYPVADLKILTRKKKCGGGCGGCGNTDEKEFEHFDFSKLE
ncbi:MAG: regulatory iron-sulfur-containing complex subunit RicT, partial [Niameybacter sp.]